MGFKLKPTKKSEEATATEKAIVDAVAEVTAEATEKKAKKAKKQGRKDEAYYLAKYPHAIAGTLRFEPEVNKQTMEIACQHEGCTNVRRVYTSDLFQIKTCLEHSKLAKAAKRGKVAKSEAEVAAEAPATEA